MGTGLRMTTSTDPSATGDMVTIRSCSGVCPVPDWLAS